ncbi:chemotaxis sensory transducer [Marinomonas sp. MED121]|uniref:methyl-accepting chemotaxis protein n=1 Tax=Marinomonas sp. MED121 TaxID=314277 RepID=UPI000069117B|nr:methyl-accepting chemotaxis protein [Marinomonas sp. MED121]EAQ67779.1 chemotaxis sensory transducer [Marinomonas sp. MED121]
MKSIQLKISLFTGLATLIAILCLSAFSILSTKSLQHEVQDNTQTVFFNLFEKQLEGRLSNSAEHITNLLQTGFLINEDLARTFISLKTAADTQLEQDNLRDNFNGILQSALDKRPEVLGVYTLWEENALDNQDDKYKNQSALGYDESGRFIPYWTRSNTGRPQVEALLSYDDSSRPDGTDRVGEYYLCSKDSHSNCLIEPYIYPVNGVDTLLTSLVTPIMIRQKFVGITGLDISLKSLEGIAKQLSDKLYNGNNRVLIISNRGGIASDSDKKETGNNIRSFLPSKASHIIENMNKDTFELINDPEDENFQAMISIKVGAGIPNWSLWISVPKAVVLADLIKLNQATSEQQFQQNIQFILVGLVITLISIVIIWWLSSQISRPVVKLTGFMKQVAQGDFTHRLQHRSVDELGQLSDACNQFLDQIQPLLKQVIISSDQITDNATQSARISAETLEGANQQQGDVMQLASAVTELSATAQNVADNTVTAADSTGKMKAIAAEGQNVLNKASSSIEALAQDVKHSSEVINRVSHDSKEIHTVMDVIRDIADQTNLLALNAAIEAARAGEQGRGFAVVADEVRSLAKRTQDSTAEIQEKIERLQASALEAVNSMQVGSERALESESMTMDANQKLVNIIHNIDDVNDLIIQVSSAAEQQRSVTDSISSNVNNITSVATQTASGATSSNETSQQLELHADELKELVTKFKV